MKKLFAGWLCFILAGGTVAMAQGKADPALDLSKIIAGATREKPFENSLGMKFAPVQGTKVLFSIWDTRVKDYRAYAQAISGVEASWKTPGFKQWDDHPVVKVSWKDAVAFCAWLTKKERKEGKIAQDQAYRLPTDEEWSAAVGDGKYPWGNEWPPPKDAGNYNFTQRTGDDEKTTPVGSFRANKYGLYDMGGNVWQWCDDWYRLSMDQKGVLDKFTWLKEDTGAEKFRVVRGASWDVGDEWLLVSSARGGDRPDTHSSSYGFRCVLELGLSAH